MASGTDNEDQRSGTTVRLGRWILGSMRHDAVAREQHNSQGAEPEHLVVATMSE
jgi:hypothetical protein